MPGLFDFLPMLCAQQLGSQKLERVPEPRGVTDGADNVSQYDRVLNTKLAIPYAVGLEVIHRARGDTQQQAIDLACGPGHYTVRLASVFRYRSVLGIDLSRPMVELAKRNAAKKGLGDRVKYEVGDVTALDATISNQFDLASFTDASHHMPDLSTVNQVIYEMDRITKPDGLIMLMDLARLRTRALTDRYINVIGHDYVERGLPQFFEDFQNSMYAAWTPKELKSAIPRDTRRAWCHIVPPGLPTIQIVLGLPLDRRQPFIRRGFPWKRGEHPVSRDMRWEWTLQRRTLFVPGSTTLVGRRKERSNRNQRREA